MVVSQVHRQLLQALEPVQGRGQGAGTIAALGQGSQNPCFIEATDAKDLHNPSTEQFGSKNSIPSGSDDPPHVHEQNSLVPVPK